MAYFQPKKNKTSYQSCDSEVKSWRSKNHHQTPLSTSQSLAHVKEGQGLHPGPKLPPSEPQEPPNATKINLFPITGFNKGHSRTSSENPNFLGFGEWSMYWRDIWVGNLAILRHHFWAFAHAHFSVTKLTFIERQKRRLRAIQNFHFSLAQPGAEIFCSTTL